MLTARDIMNPHVVTAQPEWSVKRVLDLLLDEDIGSLPIVDSTGRLIGLVTESVLLATAFDPQLQSDPITLHMQRRFLAVGPEEPLGQIIEKFLLHRVRHFPVVGNQRLLGIVTRRQLLRAVLGRQTGTDLATENYIQ